MNMINNKLKIKNPNNDEKVNHNRGFALILIIIQSNLKNNKYKYTMNMNSC